MTTCPTCQTSFDAASAAGGQCPRCLLMGGAGDLDGPGPAVARDGNWVPPAVAELQPLLPAYELLRLLGRGGMGAVYKARQPALDRLVAIKLLPAATVVDHGDDFAERFKNEARMLARMSHPGIVHVYDFGVLADGSCYFVMEYVDGTDVARMVAGNGKLSPEHAASITADVCAALHYAHEAGIVHRDIKPANILVNRHGQVKVADFGLAKAQDPSLQSLTQTRMTMGTPEFLAPESLTAGMVVDHRADLYAVGVMLYNMLTGQMPRGVFPPASETAPAPRAFDDIISKAMQANPEQRYQTAAAIRSDLEQTRTCPVPAPRRAHARRRFALAGAAACIAAAAGLWQLSGNKTLPDPVPAAQPASAATEQPKNPTPTAESAADMPDLDAFFRTLQEANPDSGLLNRASRDKDGGARVHWNGAVRFLNLGGLATITNIDCLQPMRFTHLDLRGTGVRDLRPALTEALQSLYFTNVPGLETSGLRSQQLREVLVEGPHPFPLEHAVSPSLHYLDLKDVPVESLAPLAGCPDLRNLFLAGCPVQDLSPLRGVALQTLSLQTTRVTSLEPLRGMKLLHEVKIYDCPVRDFSPLSEVPGLQTLSVDGTHYKGGSLRKFLEKSQAPSESPAAGNAGDVPSILEKLARLNPGCGPLTLRSKTAEGEDLVSLNSDGDQWLRLYHQPALRDISPLAGSGFTHLDLRGTSVRDLAALRSMPLRMLKITCTAEMDTAMLRSIQTLAEVVIEGTHPVPLQDILSPALYYLDISKAAPTSLEPLKAGKTLRMLFLQDSPAADLSPLRDLPLESLDLSSAKPANLEHIRSPHLTSVRVSGLAAEALAPLLSLPKLRHIYCDQGEFTPASLTEFLRRQQPPH